MEKSRRKLLKIVGTTSAAVAGVSGTAAASTDIPAGTDGTIEDSNWSEFETYHKDQTYTDTIEPDRIAAPGELSIPNPTSYGFDICAQLPSGDSLCITSFNEGVEQYYDCAGRNLVTFGQDIVKENVNLDNGDVTVEWSVDVWIGVDSNGCLWSGTSAGGQEQCSKVTCTDWFDDTKTIADQKSEWSDAGSGFADEIAALKQTEVSSGSATATALGVGGAGAAALAIKANSAVIN